jgi:hypothetical protein
MTTPRQNAADLSSGERRALLAQLLRCPWSVRSGDDGAETPFTLILAAFYAPLHRLTGQGDLAIGLAHLRPCPARVPANGRPPDRPAVAS